jgi:cyclopropane fatty-acyl-phospholipid synthase-like methyltransferase
MVDFPSDFQKGRWTVTEPSPWTVLGESLNGYIRTEILTASCDLGLFTHLSRAGSATIEQLAEQLGISGHGVRILLLGCCEASLTERGADGAYRNTAVAETYLVEGARYCMLGFVRFTREVQQKACSLLLDSIKAGRPVGLRALGYEDTKTLYQAFAENEELERLFHKAMAEFSKINFLTLEPGDLDGVRRLLDVGGGNASVQMRVLQQNPGVQGTLFDLPTVCDNAAENVRRNGMTDRVSYHPGDVFAEELPQGHDAVLLSHFVEIFAPESIEHIYAKVQRALEPGGKLILWTMTANDGETTGPLQAVKSSVYFVASASGSGMAYPAADHRRWLDAAGFDVVTERPYPEICQTLILARRR